MNANRSNGLEMAVHNLSRIKGQKYAIALNDWVRIREYLEELFIGGWNSRGIELRSTDTPMTAPNMGREFSYSNNIPALLTNMADSMTEVVRNSHLSVVHTGLAFTSKTFIHVQWKWLALPIALTLSAPGLLLFVILKTRREDGIVWKSNSVAILFHRLDGWPMPSVDGPKELNQATKGMKGRLVNDKEVLAFVKEDG